MTSIDSIEKDIGAFPEAGKTYQTISDEIDYFLLEDSTTQPEKLKLRKLKIALNEKNNKLLDVTVETSLSEVEIFEQQKRMMSDCERIVMDAGAQIEQNTQKLKKAYQTSEDINGKLLTSSSLTLTLQRSFQRHRVVYKLVLLCVSIMICVMVIFRFK